MANTLDKGEYHSHRFSRVEKCVLEQIPGYAQNAWLFLLVQSVPNCASMPSSYLCPASHLTCNITVCRFCSAILRPIQDRLPWPNGRTRKGWAGGALCSQRSGRKCSGSWKYSGRRLLTWFCVTRMVCEGEGKAVSFLHEQT